MKISVKMLYKTKNRISVGSIDSIKFLGITQRNQLVENRDASDSALSHPYSQ